MGMKGPDKKDKNVEIGERRGINSRKEPLYSHNKGDIHNKRLIIQTARLKKT
jgi:hypothetical protein